MAEFGQPDMVNTLIASGYKLPPGFVFDRGSELGQPPKIEISGGFAPLPSWNIYDGNTSLLDAELYSNANQNNRTGASNLNNIQIFGGTPARGGGSFLNNIGSNNNPVNYTPSGGWLNSIGVTGGNPSAAQGSGAAQGSTPAQNGQNNTAQTEQHRFETTTEKSGKRTNTYYIGSRRVTYAEWAKGATSAEKDSARKAIS